LAGKIGLSKPRLFGTPSMVVNSDIKDMSAFGIVFLSSSKHHRLSLNYIFKCNSVFSVQTDRGVLNAFNVNIPIGNGKTFYGRIVEFCRALRAVYRHICFVRSLVGCNAKFRRVERAPLYSLYSLVAGIFLIFNSPRPSPPRVSTLFDGDGHTFASYLNRRTVYGEWGGGQSTIFALGRGVQAIYSVESDPLVAQALRMATAPYQSELLVNIPSVQADMVTSWGYPLSNEFSAKDYVEGFPLIDALDFILIDGRFRVACFAYAYVRAREGCVICFDDFWPRPHYHAVLDLIGPSSEAPRQLFYEIPAIGRRKITEAEEILRVYLGDPR
jgi:hypothetical protein